MRTATLFAPFAVPAARLGIGYAVGGLETLIRLVGHSAAKEIFFRDGFMDANLDEIAELVGVSDRTVKRRWRSAR